MIYPTRGHLTRTFRTMDRENFPDMPQPNWTYGRLFIYTDDTSKEG